MYDSMVEAIKTALAEKDLGKIQAVLKKSTSLLKPGENLKRTADVLVLSTLRAQGYLTKLYAMRDQLNKGPSIYEASGYIPSEAEKNDPRWKNALTVDINPYTMQKSAKKFGWNIKRNGRPPILRENDK